MHGERHWHESLWLGWFPCSLRDTHRGRHSVRKAEPLANAGEVVLVRRVKVWAEDVVARNWQETEDAATLVVQDDDDEMCPSLTQRCQRIQVVQCGQVADEDGAAAAASKCNAQTRVQDTVDAARSSVAHDYWSRRAKVIQVANR